MDWDGLVAGACAATAAALPGVTGEGTGPREAQLRSAWNDALAGAAIGAGEVATDARVALEALPGVTGMHDAVVDGGDPFRLIAEHKVWRDRGRRDEALWDAAVVAASIAEHRAEVGYLVVAAREALLDDGHPLAVLLTGGVVHMAGALAEPALADAAGWFMVAGVAGEGRVPAEIIAVPVARVAAGEGWVVAASRVVPGGGWVQVPDAELPPASSPPPPRFLRDRQKALVERFLEEVLNAHDPDALDGFVTPGFSSGIAGGGEGGVEDLRAWLAELFTAFPDIRWSSNLMLYEEKTVVVRLLGHGTHLGDYRGLAPTGRHIEVEAVHIVGLENGLMATHYRVGDEAGLLEQLRR